jgi:DNA polymerase-1
MTQKHNLYAAWEKYLGVLPMSPDLGGSGWLGALSEAQYDYAAEDVIYLHRLRDVQKNLLQQYSLNKIALIEFDAIQADAEVELNGFPIDQKMWRKVADKNVIARDNFAKELVKELPPPTKQLFMFDHTGINLESPKDLLLSLRKLGLTQKVQIGDTDQFQVVELQDTSELTLSAYTDTQPLVKKLLDYREKSTQLKTFGYEYLEHVRKDTGRLHSNFYPFTGAGRYSVKEPQTHNIPRNKEFRACFKPPPGYVFIIADFSGIEMRVIAELSRDKELIKVFNHPTDNDIHKATASFLLDLPYASITKPKKQMAKPVNFGLGFGMGHKKLAVYSKANYGVAMTEEEAFKWKKRFFQKYAGIKKWHYAHLEKFRREGLVRTIGGRLRYLQPDAFSDVFSTTVSGTATGDALKIALKLALKRLRKFDGKARIVHHVHDEIIVECQEDPELVKQVEQTLRESMIEAMRNFVQVVPTLVEIGIGDSWADK